MSLRSVTSCDLAHTRSMFSESLAHMFQTSRCRDPKNWRRSIRFFIFIPFRCEIMLTLQYAWRSSRRDFQKLVFRSSWWATIADMTMSSCRKNSITSPRRRQYEEFLRQNRFAPNPSSMVVMVTELFLQHIEAFLLADCMKSLPPLFLLN